jgi:hypothetical protein
MTATKVLWFSRHAMSAAQLEGLTSKLGEVEVTQIDGTMPSVHVPFTAKITTPDGFTELRWEVGPMKELIAEMDVVAIVAPINLQQQFLSVAGNKPVIFAKNDRVRVNVPEGEEPKFEFIFAGWERLVEVKVVTEAF